MLNLINFDTYEQYCGMDRCVNIYIYIYILFIPLSSLLLFFLSLSLLLFFFFLPPPAPCSCHSLFPFSSSFFSSIFTMASGSFSCFFFPVTISLSFFSCMSWRRRQFRFEVELANLNLCSSIWSSARRSEALLAQGQSPIFARRCPQLSSPMVG